jgi:hypothetical protein
MLLTSTYTRLRMFSRESPADVTRLREYKKRVSTVTAQDHGWVIPCHWKTLLSGMVFSLVDRDEAKTLVSVFGSKLPRKVFTLPNPGDFLNIGRSVISLIHKWGGQYFLRFDYREGGGKEPPKSIDLSKLLPNPTEQDWRPNTTIPEDFYTASRQANKGFWTISCHWQEYGKIDNDSYLYVGRLTDEDAELLAEALEVRLPPKINGQRTYISSLDDIFNFENHPVYSNSDLNTDLTYDNGHYQLRVHSSEGVRLPSVIDLSPFVPQELKIPMLIGVLMNPFPKIFTQHRDSLPSPRPVIFWLASIFRPCLMP